MTASAAAAVSLAHGALAAEQAFPSKVVSQMAKWEKVVRDAKIERIN